MEAAIAFDQPPEHIIYRDGERVVNDRALTPEEFAAIQLHAARTKQVGLLIALLLVPSVANFATGTNAWVPLLLLGAALLLLLLGWPIYHAFLLSRVRPSDRVIEIGGHLVDGRGLVLFRGKGPTLWSTFHKNVTRAAVLPQSASAALEPHGEVSWTRMMSPAELAEYASEASVGMSLVTPAANVVILLLILRAQWLIALPLLIVVLAWPLVQKGLRYRSAGKLQVKVVPRIDGKYVDWAEFLPDERVWSINGEPAEWRKR